MTFLRVLLLACCQRPFHRVLVGMAGICLSQVAGAAEALRSFNIPTDLAERSLKAFSSQSGLEVLFATTTASTIRTNAVKGNYRPREALDLLLRQTGLVAVQPEANGPLTITRELDSEEASPSSQAAPSPPSSINRERSARESTDTMKRSNPLALLFSWLAFAAAPAHAEAVDNGSGAPAPTQNVSVIEGRIFNPVTGEYVRNAEVRVQETGTISVSDESGRYRLTRLPAGTVNILVNYTGYKTIVAPIALRPGQTVVQDFNLAMTGAEETIRLEKFTVSSEREGNAKAIMEQRAAMNIKNVVASDAFGDLAEGNVGELLKFLPSMELVYDEASVSSVQIRGMASKYGSMMVDGVRLANSVAGRGPQLTTLSNNNVDSIEVSKSNSADMDADAPAGTINLRSKSALSRKGRYVAWQVNGVANSYQLSLGKTIGPDDARHHNTRFGGSLDYSNTFLNERLGVVATVSTSNWYNEQFYVQNAYNYAATAASPEPVMLTTINYKDGPKANIRHAAGITFEYKLSPELRITLRSQYNYHDVRFYNRTISLVASRATQAPGSNATTMIVNPLTTNASRLTMGGTSVERILQNGSFSLQSDYKKDRWEIDALAAYSIAFSEEGIRGKNKGPMNTMAITLFPINWTATRPDTSSTAWTFESFGGKDPYILSNAQATATVNNTQANSNSREKERYSGAINAKWTTAWTLPTFIKAGAKFQEESWDSRLLVDRYTYVGPTGNRIDAEVPVSIFPFNSEFGGNLFGDRLLQFPDRGAIGGLFREHPEYFLPEAANVTGDANRFPNAFVQEKIAAAYVMGNARVGALTLQGGGRLEGTEVVSLIYERGVEKNRSSQYDDFFLSGSAKYRFTPNLMIMAAFNQAILRPDMSNMTGRATISDTMLTGTIPNVELKAEHSNNYSLQAEYYFEPAGFVTVGVFQNDTRDIQYRDSEVTAESIGLGDEYPGYIFTSWRNADRLKIKGFEVAYNQRLTFLPGRLRGLGVFANFTRNLASDAELATTLAPNLVSAGITFDHPRMNISLKGTWTDETFWSSGTGFVRYRNARGQADFSVGYKLTRRTVIFINGRNIFDEPISWWENEPNRLQYMQRFGSNWTFGIKGTF